jgi:glycosyltransferase involved in cell wall biosynthesis
MIFAILSVWSLLRAVRDWEARIVHTHYSYSAVAAAIVSRVVGGVVIIHTSHAHDLVMTPTYISRVKGLAETFVLKMSDHVIAMTPGVKRRLVSEHNLNASKISTIFEGVSDNCRSDSIGVEHSSRDGEPKTILCVGRICPRKNQLTLVRAALNVLERNRDVRFVFAGPFADESYLETIERFVQEKHLSPWIEFTGEVTSDELHRLYRAATIFAFPSLAEMQGLAVLEAMAHGLPVVASEIEPILDISRLGPEAIIAASPTNPEDFANAILLLLEDKNRRERMSRCGRRVAAELSWDKVARRMLDTYRAVTVRNNRRRVGDSQ